MSAIGPKVVLLLLALALPPAAPAQTADPCPARPRFDCRRSERSRLQVELASSGAGADRIRWQWLRGGPITAAQLGDPRGTSSYAACLYSGPGQKLGFAAALPPGPQSWSALGDGDYYYRDRSGSGAVRDLLLRAAGRFLLRAGGALSLSAEFDVPITMQLVNPDTGTCWESIFRHGRAQDGKLRAVHRAVPRPNVILIQTDDQRWDTLGFLPTVQGELAGKGVTFANSFVPNPVCCPSRASLLTGNHAHTHGVLTNGPPHGGALKFIGPDRETIAVWLQASGYRTAFFGKYLNGYRNYCDATSCAIPPGWDEWWALAPEDYFNYRLSENGPRVFHGSAPGEYSTDLLRDRLLAFLGAHPDEPVFVYFAPYAPHVSPAVAYLPVPAPRHEGAFAGLTPARPLSYLEVDVSDKPLFVRGVEPPDALYLAFIDLQREIAFESLLAVDEAVAAILDTLERQGRLADTVVIFTSDNGYAYGEHRLFGKLCPYEECIRVPLVVRYPRLLGDQPQVVEELVAVIDLAPTIAEWAQVPPGRIPPIDGRSLAAVAQGQRTGWRDALLLEQWEQRRYAGVRTANRKYALHDTGERELYDLDADPFELSSVAAERPAEADALEAKILELGGSLP